MQAMSAALHIVPPREAGACAEGDGLEAELNQDVGGGPVAEDAAGRNRAGVGMREVPAEDGATWLGRMAPAPRAAFQLQVEFCLQTKCSAKITEVEALDPVRPAADSRHATFRIGQAIGRGVGRQAARGFDVVDPFRESGQIVLLQGTEEETSGSENRHA